MEEKRKALGRPKSLRVRGEDFQMSHFTVTGGIEEHSWERYSWKEFQSEIKTVNGRKHSETLRYLMEGHSFPNDFLGNKLITKDCVSCLSVGFLERETSEIQ